ncbi:MAG: helix-turn-helix domain-containing protein [Flavobacteriaceae bacterium]|nr:helix-turn-helix domain-containing protein [Flavobacteriaceae bacterium]
MQSSLDTWTSVFLLAVAMGLFLFFILITDKNKKNNPIAFLVLAFSVILFQYVLYWTKYEITFPYLRTLPPFCYYLTGPLLYLYFSNLYKKQVKFNFSLHFLIAFLSLIPTLVIWLKYAGLTELKIPFLFLVRGHWIISAHMALYSCMIIYLIIRNKEMNSEYAKVRHTWAKVLITLYSLFILSYISYYVLVNFSFFNDQWDYMISVMMSVSIYTIGYFIFKQPEVFDGEFYSNLFLPIKNKNETFETSLLNEFYEYLTKYMNKEKPYTDNELRLVNLADQVGFSTHLLSKIINEKSGSNFNTFVNDYRLVEAEKLLISEENPNIKSIFFQVGFNNKVTFYKAFKNKHHCTPTEFIAKS